MESVEPWSPAYRAGLRPGDRLTAWERSASFPANPIPARGYVDLPFDLERVLREEAPRGDLRLSGIRGGRPFSALLPGGTSLEASGLRSRPRPSPDDLGGWGSPPPSPERGDRGALLLAEAADSAFRRAEPDLGLWLLRERVRVLEGVRSFAAADAEFPRTARAFAARGRPREAAELLADWAESLDRRWAWDRSAAALDQAERALGERLPGDSPLTLARIAFVRGEVLRHRDDYAGAKRAHEGALSLRLAAAPGSLDHAASLYVLGRVASESGKGDADPLLRQAEAILRRLDPGGVQHGYVIDFQGHARSRVDPDGAERDYREALEIARRREPGGFLEGRVLYHLGSHLHQRGDILTAQWLLHEAWEVARRLPESYLNRYLRAGILVQQGYLNADQGDEEAGYRLAEQALALQREINPRSMGTALALSSLGQSAYLLSRLEEAWSHLTRSLDLLTELVPDSPLVAFQLLLLARTEALTGNGEKAEALLRRAAPLYEGAFSRSRSFVGWLSARSLVAGKAGRLEEAIALGRQALDRVAELGPDELGEIEMLGSLADWERAAGRKEAVREHACRAARLLERQSERFGPDESARLRLARGYSRLFALCAEAELSLGRPEAAFLAVEAGRARSLLELLAVRSLDEKVIPEAMRRELETLRRERRELAKSLEAAVGEGEAGRASELRTALDRKRGAADGIVERFRRDAGRYAELRFPRVGAVADVREALDPGTLLLEYSLGDFESLLFVLPARGRGRQGLQVLRLPLGEVEIGRRVEALRELLVSPLSDPRLVSERSRELYALLVAPAEPWIRESERLLVAADGPLHSLPFAALEAPDGAPLAARKAIHTTASAGLYVEGKKRRRPAPPPDRLRVAAFGDPAVASRPGGGEASPAADPKRSALGLQGFRLGPLPASRTEVAAIRSLFPATLAYLGAAATEGQARSLARDVEIVHFAVHALVDANQPYRSALVLAAPEGKGGGGDDGLLEASEIIAGLDLDASLVTLSACETAMGRTMGGEGLVGLTRAFQFAGTRSVLASLWAVGDRPTAALMESFYRGLRQGRSKDEALRAAQIELLRSPATSHPSNWAGFLLVGDYL